MNLSKDFYSTTEVAELIGLSRISIWNKVKKGHIKAKRAGRAYLIPKSEVVRLLPTNDAPSEECREKEIRNAVKQVVKEYGATLKKLGEE